MKTFSDDKQTILKTSTTQLLEVIGDDPTRDGLLETPERVAKAYAEIFASTGETEFKDYKLFPTDNDSDLVIVADIPFYAMCEHHLLPFFGTVTVGYVPNGEIIGLSKIPRLVNWAARRPSVQENLTALISAEMQRITQPKGVAVHVNSRHMCMEMRGINQPGTFTTTSLYKGTLKTDALLRQEFMMKVSNGK
ncbi:GTP cyclohydrolase 1 [Lactococcus hodotermopsidis]|uniref:GTP cyclohydrolase 1 n=1 Tax=Pseudolactococcus hodotermopsidis TaxID=2709157 RepID=A0A6A0BDG7_9LACT|nr:GTP cyclohydrolase I FolE [Lactococcus hodotermopsidis]GFH42514.1 GTP cyclohydrolase 1 [Lactococcus hodotermopsidis]